MNLTAVGYLPHLRVLASAISLLVAGLALAGCTGANTAGLQVVTGELPADLYLNNTRIAETPYRDDSQKPGEYTLELRPQDSSYVPYQTRLTLKRGTITIVNWQPGKRPETSGGVIYQTESLRDRQATELAITTIPDNSIVLVNGAAQGFAPVRLTTLNPGEHQFEIQRPSYQPIKQTVQLAAGQRILITAKLGKQDAPVPATTLVASGSASSATGTPAAATAGSAVTRLATPAGQGRNRPNSLPSPNPSATISGTVVRILATGFRQEGKEVLRVRAEASVNATELGFAEVGERYPFLKEIRDGWIKIRYDNQVGWVSQQFAQVE